MTLQNRQPILRTIPLAVGVIAYMGVGVSACPVVARAPLAEAVTASIQVFRQPLELVAAVVAEAQRPGGAKLQTGAAERLVRIAAWHADAPQHSIVEGEVANPQRLGNESWTLAEGKPEAKSRRARDAIKAGSAGRMARER